MPAGLAPGENITVEGGIWTTLRTQMGVKSLYNDNHQRRIDPRGSIAGAHGVLCFNNVRRLLVRTVIVRQSTPFAVQLSNASQFVIEDVAFEDYGRDGIHIDDVVLAFPRKADDKLVSIGPLSMTFTFGSSDPARWVEVFSPDKDCTVRNLSLQNVRTADGAEAAAETLVRVIHLQPNSDYPRTTPRGGTGKGVWVK